MHWRKLGLVFCPDGSLPWMHSHAALPFPVLLKQNVFRVFFSARDSNRRSHVGYADVRIAETPEVLGVSTSPVLAPGTPGMFDDSGIGLGCMVGDGAQTRMYYMGWNLGVTVPWRNSIGLACGDPAAASFQRFSAGPIMDRSPADSFTLSYPWVLRCRDGLWRMWYGSNLTWGREIADMSHAIKHATSVDGLEWNRDGAVVIGPDEAGTTALARPCVIEDSGLFRMWYAYRGEAYRIGYAESDDGVRWIRRDEITGIDTSSSGWDSEMLCYPCVFDHDGARYMLYNGNGYGATGFGLAILG